MTIGELLLAAFLVFAIIKWPAFRLYTAIVLVLFVSFGFLGFYE